MHDKNGFTLVEGLLILLVICVVGFAGWFVWDRNKDDSRSDAQQNSVAEASNKSDLEKPAEMIDEFLEIKEWGLSIPLTADLKESYYTFKDGYAYLYLDIKGDEEKACSNQAMITRATDEWLSSDENLYGTTKEEVSKNPGASLVDGVWYFTTGPNGGCTGDEELQKSANEVRAKWIEQTSKMVSSNL